MTTAFIPVRGGSKSIPLKNIKLFCGKPLVYWSVKALQESDAIDRIIVATDSKEIKDVVLSFKFGKVKLYDRSPENAQDHSSTESVMLEFIAQDQTSPADIFMLCQATSPYTTVQQVNEALSLFVSSGKESMLTCSLQKKFYWNPDGTPVNYDPKKRPRRQDFKGMYVENGAFYASKTASVLDSKCRISGSTYIYPMPEYFLFEIDEPEDWLIAEELMKNHVLRHE